MIPDAETKLGTSGTPEVRPAKEKAEAVLPGIDPYAAQEPATAKTLPV
jgi:hypothetical protein